MKLAPGTIIRADAFLFDMDGTLVDSTDAIERVWTRWALRHDLIPSQVLSAIYGVRIADTVRALAPRGSDIMQRSLSFFRRNTRKSMESFPWPVRANCWNACRVTDGLLSPQPTEFGETRMHLAGLPRAPLLVAAEDVQAGKPVPDGYRIAAENLGLDCEGTVVFENSDTGILAGRNAGCPVIAVTATHVTPVLDQIDWIENFASISVECTDRDVSLRVT